MDSLMFADYFLTTNDTDYKDLIIGLLRSGRWIFFDYLRKCFPIREVEAVANATTVTELMGISIAAKIGLRFPVMAKLIPMILYKMEIPKLM